MQIILKPSALLPTSYRITLAAWASQMASAQTFVAKLISLITSQQPSLKPVVH
jgi:hypothetical protein